MAKPDKMGSLEVDTSWKARRREEDRIKPKAKALMNEGAWKVYVSHEMARADLKKAEKLFARFVKSDTRGALRGEIRGYDAEGGAPTSGDMRDTWALTLVDPKTKVVVDFWQFAPLGDPDQHYDYEMEAAMNWVREEEAGTITHAQALKQMQDLEQADAESTGEEGVEMFLDSLKFEEMFPKYEQWAATHRVPIQEKGLFVRRHMKIWTPRTFKRPVPDRTYWRRGSSKFIEAHQREHPRST